MDMGAERVDPAGGEGMQGIRPGSRAAQMLAIMVTGPLLPFCGAAVTMAAYVAFSILIGRVPAFAKNLQIPDRVDDVARAADELLYRNLLIAALVGMVMVIIAIGFIGWSAARRYWGRSGRTWFIGVTIGGAMLAALAYMVVWSEMSVIFRLYFDSAQDGRLVELRYWPPLIYVISMISVLQFTIGVGSLLSVDESKIDGRTLRARFEQLDLFLKLGSAMLIFAVLTTFSMWSLGAVAHGETVRGEMRLVAVHAAQSSGLLWSILLAAVYLPAAGQLRSRSLGYVEAHSDGDSQRESLLAQSGAESTAASLKRLLAICGPLLVGVATGPGEALIGMP